MTNGMVRAYFKREPRGTAREVCAYLKLVEREMGPA